MADIQFDITAFSSEDEISLQELEKKSVFKSFLLGLIQTGRSFGISHQEYFPKRFEKGFILVGRDVNCRIIAKAVFVIKSIIINNKSVRAIIPIEVRRIQGIKLNEKMKRGGEDDHYKKEVKSNESHVTQDENSPIVCQILQNLIMQGLEKARREYACEIAYILVDDSLLEGKTLRDTLQSPRIGFSIAGEIISQQNLQTHELEVQKCLDGNLNFREILPVSSSQIQNETIQFHKEQIGNKDLYCEQVYNNEKTHNYVIQNEQNVYGVSVFIDNKEFSVNFQRFVFNAKLVSSSLFVRLFYILVNLCCFFMCLLMRAHNEEKLFQDDLKIQLVLCIGLNIGICLAFFQTHKAFKRFQGPIARIIHPFHIEKQPVTQMKRREIFEMLLRNVQGICFQNGLHQVRVEMDSRSDYWDYFNQRSAFNPYTQSSKTCLVKSLTGEKYNFTQLCVDPREL